MKRDTRVDLGKQIFAIASSKGALRLSKQQEALLVGKARWIAVIAKEGLPVVPTICLTRAAWGALKDEWQSNVDDNEPLLRDIWVRALFKLTDKDNVAPHLVVRTSAKRHNVGLMRAKTGIKSPKTIAQSVDINLSLGKAIDKAFSSYASYDPVWADANQEELSARQIVIIQQETAGEMVEFYSRDMQSGMIGPVAFASGDKMPDNIKVGKIVESLDRKSAHHMLCLIARQNEKTIFISARTIKASAAAEFEASVDRVERGYLSPKQAVLQVDVEHLPQVLHPRLAKNNDLTPIGNGLGVSPGAASGIIVFTSEDAIRAKARSIHCILVANETGAGDIDGMKAATGILTARGGQNSHAAIIARVSAKPCVAGVFSLEVDALNMRCKIGGRVFNSGDKITIDGTDGNIFADALPLLQPDIGGTVTKLLNWSDGSRTIAVRTNVETVKSAITALDFGAEGIGLARSEHMFFTHSRMLALRRLIFSKSDEDRAKALKGLVEYQSDDYAELFIAMESKPVTVRLFDPPLHEFLPKNDEDIEETAKALDIGVNALKRRLERMNEVNPMLGNRGCRLAISHPEILQMQIHAMFGGARVAKEKTGKDVKLEIMVPFIASSREVLWLKTEIEAIAKYEKRAGNIDVAYSFGTMIELPRAALRAAEIAPMVDFFSFGTNDLTQTCFGISRDDSPAFLATYIKEEIYDTDPFDSIDQAGVGELIKIAIERGRKANPSLKIGICGEHAGDPASIRFFATLGVDYISCSPYRVPIARLTLAQAQQQS
jgi:pyruvate,orthophosphate dikinase